MRWHKKIRKTPARGTERERSSFLFWPRTINGETRWLERATILQRYGPTFEEAATQRLKYFTVKWHDVTWIDYGSRLAWRSRHPWPRPNNG